MITKVVAKNFKGRDFEINLGPKTIICGPNGTGKSAIVQALELAINGHVSGGTYKTNAAILEAFGRGEKLTVEATVDKVQLARQFIAGAKGTVSQAHLVDRRRSDAKSFEVAAWEHGAPKVVVVDDFLQLSPAKMISYLAAFTGGEEIEQLASQIVTETEKLNDMRAKLRENDAYISRTMAGIAELKLPAGTLAEIQAEIRIATKELARAKADLKEAEKAEADRKAAEKAEADHQAQLNAALEFHRKQELTIPDKEAPPLVKYPVQEEVFGPPPVQAPWKPHQGLTAVSSLRRVLEAIDGLQCPVCKSGFVRLVILNELKKWEGK